jgi:hypothetical protein
MAKNLRAPGRIVLVPENAAEFSIRISEKIPRGFVVASQFQIFGTVKR